MMAPYWYEAILGVHGDFLCQNYTHDITIGGWHHLFGPRISSSELAVESPTMSTMMISGIAL